MSRTPKTYKPCKPLHTINFSSTTRNYNRQFGTIQDTSINPEEIKYTLPSMRNCSNLSYKDIKISAHARETAVTRLGTSSEREIQKIAACAKKSGLNMNNVSMMNYHSFGLSFEEYRWLVDKVFYNKDTESAYFYRGRFFIFTGNRKRTLKTIIYPGSIIENERKSGDDIVDKFFADIDRNRMHNITIPSRKITRPQ